MTNYNRQNIGEEFLQERVRRKRKRERGQGRQLEELPEDADVNYLY